MYIYGSEFLIFKLYAKLFFILYIESTNLDEIYSYNSYMIFIFCNENILICKKKKNFISFTIKNIFTCNLKLKSNHYRILIYS